MRISIKSPEANSYAVFFNGQRVGWVTVADDRAGLIEQILPREEVVKLRQLSSQGRDSGFEVLDIDPNLDKEFMCIRRFGKVQIVKGGDASESNQAL